MFLSTSELHSHTSPPLIESANIKLSGNNGEMRGWISEFFNSTETCFYAILITRFQLLIMKNLFCICLSLAFKVSPVFLVFLASRVSLLLLLVHIALASLFPLLLMLYSTSIAYILFALHVSVAICVSCVFVLLYMLLFLQIYAFLLHLSFLLFLKLPCSYFKNGLPCLSSLLVVLACNTYVSDCTPHFCFLFIDLTLSFAFPTSVSSPCICFLFPLATNIVSHATRYQPCCSVLTLVLFLTSSVSMFEAPCVAYCGWMCARP